MERGRSSFRAMGRMPTRGHGGTAIWFARDPVTGAHLCPNGSTYVPTPADAGSTSPWPVIPTAVLWSTPFGGTAAIQPIDAPSQPNHVVDLNATVNLEMICGTGDFGWVVRPGGRAMRKGNSQVTLTKGFYLGKYEVTQAQYAAVMTGNTLGLSAPSEPVAE